MPQPRQLPDENLSFFQNYIDHTDAVINQHKASYTVDNLFRTLSTSLSFSHFIVQILNEPIESKLNFCTPLYDAYDYVDEIVGAVGLPLVGLTVSMYCIVMTSKELIHLAMTKVGLCEHNKGEDNHCVWALLYTLAAITSTLLSILSALKCTISLLTRPIATLVKGVNTGNEQRFGAPSEDEDEDKDAFHPG